MSTFICEQCGCIDNTALAPSYHTRNVEGMWTDHRILCTVCAPKTYADGMPVEDAGIWHNHFERTHWSTIGKSRYFCDPKKIAQGNFVNSIEYFKNLKKGIGDAFSLAMYQQEQEVERQLAEEAKVNILYTNVQYTNKKLTPKSKKKLKNLKKMKSKT